MISTRDCLRKLRDSRSILPLSQHILASNAPAAQ